jgi:NPCBM/NEW2 domain
MQDGLGGFMRRRRTPFWTLVGVVVAVVAGVLVAIQLSSGASSNAASSPSTPGSTGVSRPSSGPAPVVTPSTSSRFSYLSDLKPSGGLGELVRSGPVTITGSIYPKSISFYCNVGDPTAFPAYRLKPDARRFQATIGLPTKSPSAFQGALMILGGGRTLRTVIVTAAKPKTIDINVRGVHTLRLECFGSGNSYTGGEAIAVSWGNARIAAGP